MYYRASIILYHSFVSLHYNPHICLVLSLAALFGHVGVLGHAEQAGRHFQDLVGRQIFHARVQRHVHGGNDARRNALVGRSHIVEGLGLAHVHFQVAGTLVNADTIQVMEHIVKKKTMGKMT